MQSRYKVVISSTLLYKEVELLPDMNRLTIGTGIHSDVRLRKDIFFESIELVFIKNDADCWTLLCSDNLYLSAGDIRKLMTKKMEHGDTVELRYQQSDLTVFSIEYLIDFDDSRQKYERVIDITGQRTITIGSDRRCNIVLNSRYTTDERIELNRVEKEFSLYIQRTKYGAYHNGKKEVSGATVHNGDFLSLSDFSFYIKDDQMWTYIRNDMWINGLRYQDMAVASDYPLFRRNTRIKNVLNTETIPILDPPEQPEKPKNNLFMRLLPSLGMMLAAGVMAFMGSGMIIMSLISGSIAVITAILNFREGNKDYDSACADRIQQYSAYIAAKREEIWKLREEERIALERKYPAIEQERNNIFNFSSDLFDRVMGDDDFLHIRLGTGAVEAARTIDYKTQERLKPGDELQIIPQQISQEYRFISRAPVTVDMKLTSAVGIYGSEDNRFNLMKNIVVDIAARQYSSDVKLIFVAEEKHRDRVFWLRMLPHVYNESVGNRGIVCDDDSKNLIFEYLYKELSMREQTKKSACHLVVFLYDDSGFNTHPVCNYKDKAKDLGVTFVFFGETKAQIPTGCGYLIELSGSGCGKLIDTTDESKSQYFDYNALSDQDAAKIVEILAPVYTEEISLESSLTKNYSMFEMLNIIAVDDIDLGARWAKSQVFKSMSAPIGISKTGMVSLDLHDKAHGPHGLVAGTTGAGKSEILQTYILSMSTLYHPYEVSFVIIDFKGGGMVNQFKELPHLLGAITNIDGKEINRSLKSIKAELQKRQRLFAEAEVNHIDKYIRKFKAGETHVPLPHLIIIVDEFAELKAEQPEFMKELISAARIGRSLGVHLILATQKPSGQVNEQIWSNSRFKLCLKVQSKEDSNEVLKSPLAAEIKEPGRAYLQVGNNEIFELFQSAYSGASEKIDDSSVKEFTIHSMSPSGRRTPVFVQKRKKAEGVNATQLDAIVEYVANYCRDIGLKRLPSICLPPLNSCIAFRAQEATVPGQFEVEIGVFDDPDNQYQGVYSVDLASNNLILIGSSQSGKTNVLQCIIRSLSTKYSPNEVSIYIIDFASMVLKNFEKLNHVGGVVCPSEDEKLKNLLKLLRTEIEERKTRLMSVGVSSFAAYREAGMSDMPLMILLIDNLTALKEMYFQDDDELLSLCREGLTVGLSIVIANAQTSGIGYKYLSNFSSRIALFCNDSSEYNTLFTHCSERIENIPGRCIVELDKRHVDCQAYLAFKGEKEIDRVKDIKDFITNTNSANNSMAARRIPLIPATLTQAYMAEEFSIYMKRNFSVVAGLDYSTVTPAVIDFSSLGLLAITGRENSGKHNWVRYSVSILEQMYPSKTRVYVVDGIEKRLGNLRTEKNVSRYSMIPDDAIACIKEIEGQLRTRYEALVAGDDEVLRSSELLVLVIDNQDAITAICNDREALAAYKNITGRYKNMRVCMIAFIDNANIPYGAPEMLKNIKEQRHIMFFDDMSNMKIFDVPISVVRNFRKPIETGDGYYIREAEFKKLKTPLVPKL